MICLKFQRTYKLCIVNNQARQALSNINSTEPIHYPFTVSNNKCGRSCNTIDDPYARICVPNKVNNINVKVFDLKSRVNETKFLF